MSDVLLKKLNAEQKEAVTHKQGPLLIVAGAGTGKTTVITNRITYLINKKSVKPDEFLALTFTEKAAGEMEERIDKLLPYGYVNLWISTFHAFCQRILEEHAIDIGMSNDFALLNETGQWLLVHNNFETFDLDYYKPLGNPTKFIHALLKHFSRVKDEAIFPEDYLEYAKEVALNSDSSGFISQVLTQEEQKKLSGQELTELTAQEIKKINEVANAYYNYQQLLNKNNSLDFGDLIIYCLRLFKKRPKLLAYYRNKFKYILVDEFQDTNWAQYELLKLLAAPSNNLTVCADDDQSIFKFRGASVSNILQFKNDYPSAKEVFLTKNYRSCQNILDLSYRFIQLNNPERLEVRLAQTGSKLSKRLEAQRQCKAEIKLISVQSQEDEMKAVIKKIIELKSSGKGAVNWSDFAILVRANNQADLFNYGLSRSGIPYQFLASRGLYNKSVVLDILAYLKLLDNYHEGPAMYRVLCLPIFNFSQEDLINFNYWSKRKAISLFQVLTRAEALSGVRPEILEEIKKALSLIEKHSQLARDQEASKVVLAFLEDSGYLKNLTHDQDAKSQEDLNYLTQFYKRIGDFEANSADKSVKAFLNLMDLELASGEQGSLITDFEEGPDTVKVMTIHSSKGLEFKYVFVVNMVDRRFPTTERRDLIKLPEKLVKEIIPAGDIHLQEERRLFYVACTRAKDGFYLTAAKDYGGSRQKKPSIFLYDLGLITENIKSQKNENTRFYQERKEQVKNIKSKEEHFQLPAKISYSQLKAYDSCPWQYRFAFLLKIPVSGKAVFSFGKTIHSVAHKIFEQIMLKKGTRQVDLFGHLTNSESLTQGILTGELIDFKEILKFYEESWTDDWYLSSKDKENYYKKGRELLKNFYESIKDKNFNPIFLEKEFNAKVIDSETKKQYTLYGVIDRIDEVGDKLKIIDYKTGKAKEKLSAEDKYQLLIYQLAARQVLEKPVDSLVLEYLEGNIRQEFLGTEKELKKVEEKIIQTMRSIEKRDFAPKPGNLCQFCDFQGICEYRA